MSVQVEYEQMDEMTTGRRTRWLVSMGDNQMANERRIEWQVSRWTRWLSAGEWGSRWACGQWLRDNKCLLHVTRSETNKHTITKLQPIKQRQEKTKTENVSQNLKQTEKHSF